MRVVSERRMRRDEVYLEVYPDHLAPVHQLKRTRIADFCPRNEIFAIFSKSFSRSYNVMLGFWKCLRDS